MLFLCTGNICRTPMAVGFFRALADRYGIDATADSAGLSFDGRPATPDGVAVMAERGIDTSDHRSRIMTVDHLRDADLVIGLAREHLREAVVLERDCFPKAFTLKELVRRGEADGGRRRSDESIDDWVRRLGADRVPRDLIGDDPDDDVADPIGRPRKHYQATADEIGDLVRRLLAVLYPDTVPQ